MLAIINLLLASLAMSVSGISIPSSNITSFSPANNTIQKPEVGGCVSVAPGILVEGDTCECFAGFAKGSYGVDRSVMIDAIYNACVKFTGWIGAPVSQYGMGEGLTQDRTSYHLYPTTHNKEEGQIAVTIHVKHDDACAGPLDVSYDYCWDSLHLPLDNCDVEGENGKYGGIKYHDCLYWILDPNPRLNYPYAGQIG